jgi:hypothetical protein
MPRGDNFKGNPGKWKKGESGNHNGRPRTAPELEQYRHVLSPENIRLIVARLACMGKEQFKAHFDNPKTLMIDVILGGIINRAIVDGDPYKMTFLIEKILGHSFGGDDSNLASAAAIKGAAAERIYEAARVRVLGNVVALPGPDDE